MIRIIPWLRALLQVIYPLRHSTFRPLPRLVPRLVGRTGVLDPLAPRDHDVGLAEVDDLVHQLAVRAPPVRRPGPLHVAGSGHPGPRRLLWPAVVYHAALAAWCVACLSRGRAAE